jgi:phage antirepressor YoqD-like protein
VRIDNLVYLFENVRFRQPFQVGGKEDQEMLEEIAKKYGMTDNSLRFLIRRGIIQKVPTDKDMDILAALSQIWNDHDWLKISLRRGIKSKARREKFIRELDLTKPERYVLNRYLNAKGRLSVKQVAGEVSTYYGLPEGIAKGVIRKMRKRAYMAKHRKKPEKDRLK